MFFTKLQVYPVACFAFVFADALRDAFTVRGALWRVAVIGVLSAALVASPLGHSLVSAASGYVQGAGSVMPPAVMHERFLKFVRFSLRCMPGFFLVLAAGVLAVLVLKPPRGRTTLFGLTQTEWFTLGILAVALVAMSLSGRFFYHYGLIALPMFPLILAALAARAGSGGWASAVPVGLAVLALAFQALTFAQEILGDPIGDVASVQVQRVADKIREACPAPACRSMFMAGTIATTSLSAPISRRSGWTRSRKPDFRRASSRPIRGI